MSLSARTRSDLAKAERRRDIEAAGRDSRAAVRREVEAGVSETVALREARGESFTRSTGTGSVRRQTGIEFLAKADKLKGDHLAAAIAYGQDYRAAHAPVSIRSNLGDHEPSGQGPNLNAVVNAADRRHAATQRLANMRACMGNTASMVRACDLILGCEQTPREAGGNALGAAVLTSLMLAAIEQLVTKQAAFWAEWKTGKAA
jgi:hypothetical protein